MSICATFFTRKKNVILSWFFLDNFQANNGNIMLVRQRSRPKLYTESIYAVYTLDINWAHTRTNTEHVHHHTRSQESLFAFVAFVGEKMCTLYRIEYLSGPRHRSRARRVWFWSTRNNRISERFENIPEYPAELVAGLYRLARWMLSSLSLSLSLSLCSSLYSWETGEDDSEGE